MNNKQFLFILTLFVALLFTLQSANADAPVQDYFHRYAFDSNFTDVNGTDLTLTGNTFISVNASVGNGSAYFDGTGDKAENTGSHGMGTGFYNISYSVWLYPQQEDRYIMGIGQYPGSGSKMIYFLSMPSADTISKIGVSADCSIGVTIQQAWQHIVAMALDNNTFMLYKNGSLVGSCGFASGTNYNGNLIRFGESFTSGSNYQGWIDEALIFKRSLTSAEITQLYNSPNGTPAAPTPNSLTTTLLNNVTETSLGSVYFFNVSGTFNITYFNITSSGYCASLNGNGSYTNCTTTGSGTNTFFNTTQNNYVVTGANTTSTSTYQALLNISVYQLYTNNTINSFNITNNKISNTTTTSNLIIKASNGSNNVLVLTAGNHSLNATCSITSPFSTGFCAITGVYDSLYTFGASYLGNGISSFTINVLNTTLLNTNISTTNGSTVFPLLQGYFYNVSFTSDTYVASSVLINPSNFTNTYNFSVQLTNTFNISFINEITETPVNETVTLEVITSETSYNLSINSTDVTGYNLSLLSPGEYTLRYRSNSYTERDYIVTLQNNSYLNIDLYMITVAASSDLITNVENTAGEQVENATVTLLRYFVSCNCYKTVEMSRTSAAGQSIFWVQAFDGHYKWSINYLGTNKFLSTSPENIATDIRYFTIDTGQDYYGSYTSLTNMASLVTYNQTSGVLTFTWSDPNNIVTRACLYARYVNGTQWSKLSNCGTGASGSVVLTLDNTTRYQYDAVVDTNTEYSSHTLLSGWVDNFNNFFDQYSTLGAFLGSSVMMGLSLLFSFSAIAVLIINAVGMLVLGLMGITKITTTFLLGFITLSIGMSAFLMRR